MLSGGNLTIFSIFKNLLAELKKVFFDKIFQQKKLHNSLIFSNFVVS